MVTRHAQVGQQAVHMVHAIVAHPLAEIPEVAPDKGEPVVIDDIPFSVGILVEAVEMALSIQMTEDFPAVTATTEGNIHINTVGLDSQPVNALLEKHRNMVRINNCHIVRARYS